MSIMKSIFLSNPQISLQNNETITTGKKEKEQKKKKKKKKKKNYLERESSSLDRKYSRLSEDGPDSTLVSVLFSLKQGYPHLSENLLSLYFSREQHIYTTFQTSSTNIQCIPITYQFPSIMILSNFLKLSYNSFNKS